MWVDRPYVAHDRILWRDVVCVCECVCTLFNDAEICYVYIELVIDECMRMEHKRNGSDGGKPKYR